jgi:hypothetical protein
MLYDFNFLTKLILDLFRILQNLQFWSVYRRRMIYELKSLTISPLSGSPYDKSSFMLVKLGVGGEGYKESCVSKYRRNNALMRYDHGAMNIMPSLAVAP